MNCEKVQDLLYDFLNQRLDSQHHQKMEKHLSRCAQCQIELDKLIKDLFVLKKWETPEVSPEFEERVWKRIEGQTKGFSKSNITKKLFSPFYVKLPLEGLAIAIILIVSLSIYKEFLTRKVFKLPREVKITLNEVKNPILLEIEKTEISLENLNIIIKDIIKEHNGKHLQSIFLEKGVKITFNIKNEDEKSFFNNLSGLGKVHLKKDGYKDKEGNIVIILLLSS